jgi:hypothetical protein
MQPTHTLSVQLTQLKKDDPCSVRGFQTESEKQLWEACIGALAESLQPSLCMEGQSLVESFCVCNLDL